jgi:D-alanyl-D-alanine carboxypeptidase
MPVAANRRPPASHKVSARLALPLLAFLACVLALSACQTTNYSSSTSPINPANRPTTVGGYTNGQLPASQLYVVSGTCTMYRAAVGSYQAMVNAAKADGVALAPAECYRNFAGQVYWRNYWCAKKICANAATPGYSNHGWGKAVDFRDQKGSLNWTSAGYKWLVAHAGEVNEAWHWEWVGDGGTLHGYGVRTDLMYWAS